MSKLDHRSQVRVSYAIRLDSLLVACIKYELQVQHSEDLNRIIFYLQKMEINLTFSRSLSPKILGLAPCLIYIWNLKIWQLYMPSFSKYRFLDP